ncbi:TadE/TadG family type IV pilus assembly protein [Paenibacillus sp. P13VS]|uniref:TadE/TadG family type IV pilus assembly protein n=1 Tax=Paenibacillus sp. P13VS TaxID=2697367 RepID=UPI00187B57A1|nr:TadE family protein [Paenibacillus sp. P13VS]MBE7680944.1 pilus assembly protein [Paenibacillus sp. P13VS]
MEKQELDPKECARWLLRLTRLRKMEQLKSLPKQASSSKKEQGSMVLEASLVLPVFLFFVMFLVYIVQMTLISTALQSTAGEAVKQLSTKIYPVSLVFTPSDSAGGEEKGSGWSIPELSLTEWAEEYASSLPDPLSNWMRAAASSGEQPLQEIKTSVIETVLDPAIKPLLQPFIDPELLDMERIHVNGISVPDLKNKTNPYFRLELSYELPIKVPFLGKPLRIQAAAAERIWIGDTGEGSNSNEGNGDAAGSITVLSKPEPAYIGNNATIKVQVEPGATANLTIFYKSGESTAKHIGWATADENGVIEWNWFVGTRTTEGTWTFVVETADGSKTTTEFNVASRK